MNACLLHIFSPCTCTFFFVCCILVHHTQFVAYLCITPSLLHTTSDVSTLLFTAAAIKCTKANDEKYLQQSTFVLHRTFSLSANNLSFVGGSQLAPICNCAHQVYLTSRAQFSFPRFHIVSLRIRLILSHSLLEISTRFAVFNIYETFCKNPGVALALTINISSFLAGQQYSMSSFAHNIQYSTIFNIQQ